MVIFMSLRDYHILARLDEESEYYITVYKWWTLQREKDSFILKDNSTIKSYG